MLNKFILSFSFIALLSACGIGGGVSPIYNLPSMGEDSAPSDSEYFYIDLEVDKYKSSGELVPFYEISTTTEYGDAEERDSLSNCEIYYEKPEGDEAEEKIASDENLICILDLLEYEFMVKDIHLVYNFPEGMCDYIRFSLPWHFNHEILPGPIVNKCTGHPGTDEEGNPTEGKEGLCQVNSDGECTPCLTEDVEEEDFCSPSDSIGDTVIRCCSGGSKEDGAEWKPDIQCFGGPSLIAELEGGEKEFYEGVIEESPEGGLRQGITLPDLVSINGAESYVNNLTGITSVSSPFVNYLKALDRSPDKLTGVRRDSLPDFLQKSPHYDYRPELFFQFTCLDSAGDTLHKILLMIREWNTYAEFKEFYNAGGDDSADPDVEGTEGSDCDYEDFSTLDGEVEPCNDLLDLDDIENCQNYAWCSVFDKPSLVFEGERAIYPRIRYSETSAASYSEEE